MNAPLPENLRLCGASPGDYHLLTQMELIKRRTILFEPQSGQIGDAYRMLNDFRRVFHLSNRMGMTFIVENPYFKGYAVLAWSMILDTNFVWADKAYIFDSSAKLWERQRSHPKEFERHEQNIFLACDVGQCCEPANHVAWRTLLLLRQVQRGG